ncbi:MAG: hypothetical protein ABIT69_01970 [Sphingomicrobium sp.]
MRAIFALPLVALVAACQVTKDKDNNQVSVAYDQNTADKSAAAVVTTAQNVAADIGNDVKRESGKVKAKLDEQDAKTAAPAQTNAN